MIPHPACYNPQLIGLGYNFIQKTCMQIIAHPVFHNLGWNVWAEVFQVCA